MNLREDLPRLGEVIHADGVRDKVKGLVLKLQRRVDVEILDGEAARQVLVGCELLLVHAHAVCVDLDCLARREVRDPGRAEVLT